MAGSPHAESEAAVLSHHDMKAASGKALRVSIVTPRGAAMKDHLVDEITAPGALGEFGVLPGHLPFLTALRSGVLSLRAGATREVYAVGPGYVQVAGDEIKVLVSRAEKSDEIDVDTARGEVTSLTEEMKGKSSLSPEFAELKGRLDWARAQVDASDRGAAGAGGGGKKH
jgi:F-type H+-transporting ATPase subunit epsilon